MKINTEEKELEKIRENFEYEINRCNVLSTREIRNTIINTKETTQTKEYMLMLVEYVIKRIYVLNIKGDYENREILINAQVLKEMFKNQYKTILNKVLKLSILKFKSEYSTATNKSRTYELSEEYVFKKNDENIVRYKLTNSKAKELYKKSNQKKLVTSFECPIMKSHLLYQSKLKIFTEKELKEIAQQFIDEKRYFNGCRLDMRRRPKNNARENVYYVLDDIKLYLRYNNNDVIFIPELIKNRVYTQFNLLPKWIKVATTEYSFDYSCLHPNIIQTVYGGKDKLQFITHDKVAEYLQLDRATVKKQHLSYFNDKVKHMTNMKVHKYYNENNMFTLSNCMQRKLELNHKITYLDVTAIEYKLMRSIIQKLFDLNIYVEYVFDEIYCLEEDKEIVEALMNIEAINHNVYTNVSDKSIDDCQNIIDNYICEEPNQWLDEINEELNLNIAPEAQKHIKNQTDDISNTDISKENLDAQTETKTDIFFETKNRILI